LIRERETGFGFISGSVDSLAEVLREVARMPVAALSKMGSAGRDWMRTEFSPTAYQNRVLKLYGEIGVI
jgi:glycosyltransferase involved in cell wall biosynthesis